MPSSAARPLILASASPRRAALLRSAGYSFSVRPADVDETPRPDELPPRYVARLSAEKARVVAALRDSAGAIVVAADTTVVVDDRILGKPADDSDAARMLNLLGGRVHDVLTGVVVAADGREIADVVRTRVHFVPLSRAEIDWYLASGEPEGKAGAYAIQGLGARFIDWIDGSWSNVVGLPVAAVARMIERVSKVVS